MTRLHVLSLFPFFPTTYTVGQGSDMLCVLQIGKLKSQEVDLPQLAWEASKSCDQKRSRCISASLSGCVLDSSVTNS